MSITRSGSDLLIQDLATGETIRAEYHFWSGTTGNGYGLEMIRFEDGTIWDRQAISDETSGLSARSANVDRAAFMPVRVNEEPLIVWNEAADAFLLDQGGGGLFADAALRSAAALGNGSRPGDWQREIGVEDLLIRPNAMAGAPMIGSPAEPADGEVILSVWAGETHNAFLVGESFGYIAGRSGLDDERVGRFGQEWRFSDWPLTLGDDGIIGAPRPHPNLDVDVWWTL